jgi:hypothetical protein
LEVLILEKEMDCAFVSKPISKQKTIIKENNIRYERVKISGILALYKNTLFPAAGQKH